MKNLNQIISQFNKPETLLVVSAWPYEEEKQGYVYDGMARYTKRTISAIALQKNLRFVVLVEKNNGDKPKLFCQNRVLVLPVFDKKKISLYPVILQWLTKFNNIKKVFVHSEFCISGGLKTFILLLPFLLLIKLYRRKLTFFAHNIVTSFTSLAPHFNLKQGSLRLKIFNLGLKPYYYFLGLITDQIVVLDQVIADRLKAFVDARKIILTPHWIAKVTKPGSQAQARKKIGIKPAEKVILCFGFCTWYKGADWIIKQIKNEKIKTKNIRLIMAGGEAYSLKDKQYYKNYYQKLLDQSKKAKNITITGFLAEKNVGLYFKAADLVVFPYRGLIGASGSLSYALAFGKPFLLSTKMAGILKSEEVKNTLTALGLREKDLIFTLNKNGFGKILAVLKTKKILGLLKTFSSGWADMRSEEASLKKEFETIYQKDKLDLSGLEKKLLPGLSFSH